MTLSIYKSDYFGDRHITPFGILLSLSIILLPIIFYISNAKFKFFPKLIPSKEKDESRRERGDLSEFARQGFSILFVSVGLAALVSTDWTTLIAPYRNRMYRNRTPSQKPLPLPDDYVTPYPAFDYFNAESRMGRGPPAF